MTLELVSAEIELTNSCTCETYDEETDTATHSEYCYGDCFTEQRAYLAEAIDAHLAAIGLLDADAIRIDCDAIGWQRRAGYAIVESTADGILDALAINGDYTLNFWFGDNYTRCHATRYSHDEPTGSGLFTFSAASTDETELSA